MVAVPCVGCKMLKNCPDSRGCGDEPPWAAGIVSSTWRLTTSRSGRNAYQATPAATAATRIAIFIHVFIFPLFHLGVRRLALSKKMARPKRTNTIGGGSRAASKIALTTRSVAVYIGLWSTRLDSDFAPLSLHINFCVLG